MRLFRLITSYRPGLLAYGTISASAWQFSRLGLQTLSLILLARALGPDAFGLVSALFGLAVVAGGWVGLGSGFVLLRHVSSEHGVFAQQWTAANRLTVLSGAAISLLYLMAANPALDLEISWTTLTFIAVTELLLYPLAYVCSFSLQAHERVGLGAAVQTIMSFSRLVGVLLLSVLPIEKTVDNYAATTLGAAIAGYASVRLLVQARLRPHKAGHWPMLRYIRQGLPYAASWSTTIALSEADKVLALRLTGAHMAGIYSIAYRLVVGFAVPVSALAYTLMPRLFRLWNNGERKAASATMRFAVLSVSLYATLAAGAMVAIAPLVPFVLGPGYESTATIARSMAPLVVILSFRIAAANFLTALGLPGLRAKLELASLPLLLILAWMITPNYGIVGLISVVIVVEACLALLLGFQIFAHMRRSA